MHNPPGVHDYAGMQKDPPVGRVFLYFQVQIHAFDICSSRNLNRMQQELFALLIIARGIAALYRLISCIISRALCDQKSFPPQPRCLIVTCTTGCVSFSIQNTMNDQLHSQPLKVWNSLVKTCLPLQDPSFEFWWQHTGYQLAVMAEAAQYSIQRQYEILLFHYHWIVSLLFKASP